MCLKTPRLRLSDCSVGRSTSMSSFTRVATGPRLPHPARSESPPLVLAVVGAILVYSATRPPLRLVDRPVARLPRRLFALRTERAREQTIRSPFERPTAGGCRPSVADPAPLTRGFSLSRGGKIQLCTEPTVGAYPRLRLAHRPRSVPLSPGSQAQTPVSSLARVTQRPTDAVSDRRLSRHCPQCRCTASLSLGGDLQSRSCS